MTAVGMGIIVLAYGFGLWGYCLVKDYDVNLYQLFDQTWPPTKQIVAGRKLSDSTAPGNLVPVNLGTGTGIAAGLGPAGA